MSKARLVITAVLVEGRPVAAVARDYQVARSWVYQLLKRYAAEGEAAYEPHSRRPRSSPKATATAVSDLVVLLRRRLLDQGMDAGADTIGWHLLHEHHIALSRATIHRILVRAAVVEPAPKKRPKSSFVRFQAAMPNETWQSDFTHYRLTRPDGRPGPDVEIITWLDDHSRYALHVTCHRAITAIIVRDTFRSAGEQYGYPASTLTDNGMVYTVRFATGRGGRTALENELRERGITQKNGHPNHPQTQGKVERFQQTMKKWLDSQLPRPTNLPELQKLLDTFVDAYNHQRPHRALPHRATPATAYQARPKAVPGTDRAHDSHDRVRTDRISKGGNVTLRIAGRLHHIGIGKTFAGTYVLLLVHDHEIRIIDAATGQILRELTLDPTRDYQPTGRPPGPTPKTKNT